MNPRLTHATRVADGHTKTYPLLLPMTNRKRLGRRRALSPCPICWPRSSHGRQRVQLESRSSRAHPSAGSVRLTAGNECNSSPSPCPIWASSFDGRQRVQLEWRSSRAHLSGPVRSTAGNECNSSRARRGAFQPAPSAGPVRLMAGNECDSSPFTLPYLSGFVRRPAMSATRVALVAGAPIWARSSCGRQRVQLEPVHPALSGRVR